MWYDSLLELFENKGPKWDYIGKNSTRLRDSFGIGWVENSLSSYFHVRWIWWEKNNNNKRNPVLQEKVIEI